MNQVPAVISFGSDKAPEDFDADVMVSAAVSSLATNQFISSNALVHSDVKFVIRVLRFFCRRQFGFYGPSRRNLCLGRFGVFDGTFGRASGSH